MDRRSFLSGTVALGSVLSGCLDSTSGDENPKNTPYTEDPNLSIDFEVIGHECLSENEAYADANEAKLTHQVEEKQIEITGRIADGDPKKSAYLQRVARNSQTNELALTVFTTDADNVENCPTVTEYRIQITYQMEPAVDFVVQHNGKRVDVFDLSES